MKIKGVLFAVIFFIGSFFLYLGVSSNFTNIDDIKFLGTINNNIYLGSKNADSTVVGFVSPINISNYEISSLCDVSSKFLDSKDENYYFYLKFNKDCSNNNFYLKNDSRIFINTNFKLNLFRRYDLINKYTDYSDEILNNFLKNISDDIDKYKIFENIDENNFNYSFIKKRIYYYELIYHKDIINDIKNDRKEKYIVPIKGYTLPTLNTKLPNSPRPYRNPYTDGIHEGWDIDTPFRQEVVAIDDGIIVNVIDGFEFEDLNKIDYSDDLTDEEKAKNLNILRGNQVWLKTMKGDVIFYGHLDEINNGIKVGDIVKKGAVLGRVGISGVPDKNYSDYHLHFELKKNPYNYDDAGKYTLLDYLMWDWYFKGEDFDYIKNNQYNIFEKN